jgi:hypothetical protein
MTNTILKMEIFPTGPAGQGLWRVLYGDSLLILNKIYLID